MSVFTKAELHYLAGGRQLGRIATVGADGTPHVVPVAWIYNAARDAIDIGGQELEQTKKFRDVARTGGAAIVIDDLASTDPWRPRGIAIRGRGEAIARPTPVRLHWRRCPCVSLVTDRRSRRPAALPLLSRPPGPISTTRRPTSSPAVCAWPACRASATSASRMAARGGATMGELPRAREAADIWLSFRAADGHSGAEGA